MDIDVSQAKQIKGYMSEFELEWLAKMAQGKRYIIEIGIWKGRSTRAMADHMNPSGILFCIDDPIPPEFFKNLEDYIRTDQVIPIVHDSQTGVPSRLHPMKEKIDMLFIDGDCSYKGVSSDIDNFSPYVKTDGIISGNNYDDYHGPLSNVVQERFIHKGLKTHGNIWFVEKR